MPQPISMTADGSMQLPEAVRTKLGVPEGGTLLLHVEDGQVRLESMTSAVAHAQAMVRHYIPEGVSLADELSQDRRRAAADE